MHAVNDIIIRTVTVFIPITLCKPEHVFREAVQEAVSHAKFVKSILVSHGISVQTIRVSVPGPSAFGSISNALNAARILDDSDADYASLGIVQASDEDFISAKFYEQVIYDTKSVSICAGIISPSGISRLAIETSASAVSSISRLDKNGFSNLRFAAVANVLPNGPFFPASYSDFAPENVTGSNSFDVPFTTALGVQGATLLQKVAGNANKSSIFELLKLSIEQVASHLTSVCQPVCPITIDFSTAPFPSLKDSVGAAICACAGVSQFSGPGSLMITSQIAASIDRACFNRTGFCGVMLPVSEDVILARDAPVLSELLVCSAVCGTGLDVSKQLLKISELLLVPSQCVYLLKPLRKDCTSSR